MCHVVEIKQGDGEKFCSQFKFQGLHGQQYLAQLEHNSSQLR
jgi:hypothetical protein